ncbi:DUF736 domain-containing protein [Pseudochelatococcus sp. B33]
MPQIGTFTKTKTGFSGRVRTVALDIELTIRPAENAAVENAPDHRLYTADDIEVGAAWDHSGEKAGDYLSVVIDDPTFTQSIRAALFQSEADATVWNLIWTRPSKRDERG